MLIFIIDHAQIIQSIAHAPTTVYGLYGGICLAAIYGIILCFTEARRDHKADNPKPHPLDKRS